MREDDTTFEAIVKRLQTDMRELKNAQRLGSDSLVGYLTHSNDLYDYSDTLADGDLRQYRLTFDNDIADDGAIQSLSIFWSIDNTDVMNNYVPPWANGADITMIVQQEDPEPTRNSWIFSLFCSNGGGNSTAYIKAFFSGTDSGQFSFERIS